MNFAGREQHVVNIQYDDGTEESVSFSTYSAALIFHKRQRKIPQVIDSKIMSGDDHGKPKSK